MQLLFSVCNLQNLPAISCQREFGYLLKLWMAWWITHHHRHQKTMGENCIFLSDIVSLSFNWCSFILLRKLPAGEFADLLFSCFFLHEAQSLQARTRMCLVQIETGLETTWEMLFFFFLQNMTDRSLQTTTTAVCSQVILSLSRQLCFERKKSWRPWPGTKPLNKHLTAMVSWTFKCLSVFWPVAPPSLASGHRSQRSFISFTGSPTEMQVL